MSIPEELRKLEEIYADGMLTDEEYHQAKQAVLEGRSVPRFDHHADPDYIRRETNQWAMWLHLSQFAGYVVPMGGLIAPIIIWQMKKDELPEINRHGRMVANWMISALIYAIVSAILCFVLIGIPLLLALVVVSIVFPIIGAMKANNGELWRYPMTINFIGEPPHDGYHDPYVEDY